MVERALGYAGPVRRRLSEAVVRNAAANWSGHALVAFKRVADYDVYYYAGRSGHVRSQQPPLPVYRARYRDGTRLYLNPAGSRVVHVSHPASRANRWLYHGLHSLDSPVLNPGGGGWYVLIAVLMVAGSLFSLTGLWLAGKSVCR